MTKQKKEVEISVMEIKTQSVDYHVLGLTPLICNCMPAKVQQQLLLPPAPKNRATRGSVLKHDPIAEFRSSIYRLPEGETLIAHLASAFKQAIACTAIDMPGAKKAQIARLMWVEGEKIPIFGVPKLFMSVVRSADINRTPDIRSRCIIPQWAARVTVSFTIPLIAEPMVSNLFAAAGQIQGVGDWRNQKGNGNYGRFKLVSPTDKEFNRIINSGGREAQMRGMNEAEPYDDVTADMMRWFRTETKARGFEICEVA